ncbi:MAG: carbamate kinase [Aerococcus sp.]|nr:carbamate kinase [Aerococcus sp.]
MSEKVVIALGGNAILSKDASAQAQQEALAQTASYLIKLIENGDQLVISHGNGPQVGNLLLQQEAADSEKNPALPLDTCVAMTQGSIGYWLSSALKNEMAKHNIDKEVATLLTSVVVSESDPAFADPSKPIGPFISEEEAKEQIAQGYNFKEDAGRGWRKVVASPKPVDIRESKTIQRLIEDDVITISCGGGGIPVLEGDGRGVEAVIDKDFASELLAEQVDADRLIILTGVDNVYLNYGKPDEQKLEEVTVPELEQYLAAGHFAPGSMKPKIEAVLKFVKGHDERSAVITSLENLGRIGETGTVGTVIVNN